MLHTNVNFQILWNRFEAQPSLIEPGTRMLLQHIKDARNDAAALRKELQALRDRFVKLQENAGAALPQHDRSCNKTSQDNPAQSSFRSDEDSGRESSQNAGVDNTPRGNPGAGRSQKSNKAG